MLVLVRHGESVANAEGRLAGRMDFPLSGRGRDQAAAAACLLGTVAGVVSSPLSRAIETASLVAPGVPVEVDSRWTELDYGELDGTRLGEVPAEVWGRWRSDPAFRLPGGESLIEVAERVVDACAELMGPGGDGRRDDCDVVVVSHVSPIKAAVAWSLGVGVEVSWKMHLYTASVTRIGWSGDRPVLHQMGALPLHR